MFGKAMDMHIGIISLILLSFNFLYAQKESEEFGEIGMGTLIMERYEKDTSAAAVILFNKGSVKVDANSTVGTVFKRHIRIKIFKKSALDEWANMELLVEKNEMSRLVAATYNMVNGKIEKSEITDSHVYKKKFTKGLEKVSFAFPNVKEGSIIEFAFTLKYEGAYLPSWQFQHTIPVVRSEYIMTGPSKITPHLRGSLEITEHIEKHSGTYSEWRMVDIPAFKYETLMPDKNSYISSIEFVYKSTWEKIWGYFIGHPNFSQVVSGHKYLAAIVEKVTAGISDPHQKVKAISTHIKQNVIWNEVCDYFADPPEEILKKKSGTSADINLLFASMLNKAGIKVALVLLSTRDHGFIQDGFPSRSQFNYVICQISIGEKELLVDATEPFLPFDMLPGRCFNHKGFLVSKELYGWIGIEPVKRDKVLLTSNLTLTEAGGLVGEVSSVKDGYAAFNARKNYKVAGEAEEIKNIFGDKHFAIKHSGTLNLTDIEKPLTENYELNLDEYAALSNDLIYLNPFVFLREESNPFSQDARDYPIDFDMIFEKVSICNITVPDNYTIEEIPKGKTFTLPENAAKCTLSVTQNGKQILAVSRLQINKTLFMQDEYPNLKEFYARIVSKMSEVIILKKKL